MDTVQKLKEAQLAEFRSRQKNKPTRKNRRQLQRKRKVKEIHLSILQRVSKKQVVVF